jgi:signal transduction histidine kinase
LSRLVDALLALARAEGASSTPVETALEDVVGARVDAWSALAAEHDVRIDAHVDAGTTVLVTPGHLDQVLDNVLSNAIDVAPAGSVVRIVAGSDAGAVELRVTDAGPGMDAEQRARAFDRFWRPAGASSGGSGLGLAIVRSLVEADGGSVDLDAAPGEGLEVRMTLRAAVRSVR